MAPVRAKKTPEEKLAAERERKLRYYYKNRGQLNRRHHDQRAMKPALASTSAAGSSNTSISLEREPIATVNIDQGLPIRRLLFLSHQLRQDFDRFVDNDVKVFMRRVVGDCVRDLAKARVKVDKLLVCVQDAMQYANRLEVELWEKSSGPEHEHARQLSLTRAQSKYLKMEVLGYLDIRGNSLLEDDYMARMNVGFWSFWPEPRGDLTLAQYRIRIKDREKLLLGAMEAMAVKRIAWRHSIGLDADGTPYPDTLWNCIQGPRERPVRPKPKPYRRPAAEKKDEDSYDYSSEAEGSKCVPFDAPISDSCDVEDV
ncbi:hypothetical protein C8J56DRAFT_1057715 [Mycena floridula]|nr:hypothetical protein C8J56DRAFT_1057715 [Mycena floridula]